MRSMFKDTKNQVRMANFTSKIIAISLILKNHWMRKAEMWTQYGYFLRLYAYFTTFKR